MGTNDIGQCIDCGRVYEPAYGPPESHVPVPENRQPPWAKTPTEGENPNNPATPRTSYAGHRKQVYPWEGRKVTHGYCRDCAKRDAAYLQAAGPEKGRRMLGKTKAKAAEHWWWRRVDVPKKPRKG